MIVDILKQKKEEKGITTEELAELSGVPVETIKKILSGEIKSPQYDTKMALERVLLDNETEELNKTRETSMAYEKKNTYTIGDYRGLPEDVRAELIDGELIFMEAPQTGHQILVMKLAFLFELFIRENQGNCLVIPAPFDVQLDCDDRTIVQPDLVVTCRKERLLKQGLYGAPDLVIEITSTSTRKMDYTKKMIKYMEAGVREYWIVDLQKRKVVTYFFEEDPIPLIYSFYDKVPVRIYDGRLEINFAELSQVLESIPV